MHRVPVIFWVKPEFADLTKIRVIGPVLIAEGFSGLATVRDGNNTVQEWTEVVPERFVVHSAILPSNLGLDLLIRISGQGMFQPGVNPNWATLTRKVCSAFGVKPMRARISLVQ